SVTTLAVNNLPAMWKIGGFMGTTTVHLCNLCWQERSNIGNFNCESWRHHTYQEHMESMTKWRDPQKQKDYNIIFKETRVQWFELIHLPYWDPTHFLAINGMHHLFLGLVQSHFRDLIVIDKPVNQELCKTNPPSTKPVEDEELEKSY
ncbi:hypothetical protein PAXRUDRAFT_170342, partial [Paxillus rubicundulus Ve08.2h10]